LKTFKYIIATFSLILCANVNAATRYVSDNIEIYLHSGPSLDYRIIGAIKVGTQLSTLKYDEDTKFMQVRTPAKKVGWVKTSNLQAALPAATLLPAVQKQLEEANKKLETIASDNLKKTQEMTQSFSSKEQRLIDLEKEKVTLQATIADLKARNLDLDLLQSTKADRVKMDWMMYGGSVLFFGILVGLIVPFIPRRKKSQNDW